MSESDRLIFHLRGETMTGSCLIVYNQANPWKGISNYFGTLEFNNNILDLSSNKMRGKGCISLKKTLHQQVSVKLLMMMYLVSINLRPSGRN